MDITAELDKMQAARIELDRATNAYDHDPNPRNLWAMSAAQATYDGARLLCDRFASDEVLADKEFARKMLAECRQMVS